MEHLLKRNSEFSISENILYSKLWQADFLKEMAAKSISYEALRSTQSENKMFTSCVLG